MSYYLAASELNSIEGNFMIATAYQVGIEKYDKPVRDHINPLLKSVSSSDSFVRVRNANTNGLFLVLIWDSHSSASSVENDDVFGGFTGKRTGKQSQLDMFITSLDEEVNHAESLQVQHNTVDGKLEVETHEMKYPNFQQNFLESLNYYERCIDLIDKKVPIVLTWSYYCHLMQKEKVEKVLQI